MPISKTSKIIISALGAGGVVGGASYAGYHQFTKVSSEDKIDKPVLALKDETIKGKLGETLLTYETKDQDKWKARAKTLSTDNSDNLSADLKKIKTETDNDGSKIKGWCQTNTNNKFTSETDQIFLEVQKYCTYNIKDKLDKAINIGSWDNANHNKKLKSLPNNEGLSDAMKVIKTKLTDGASGKDDNALKEWCKSAYEKTFKGEKDQDYLDTKNYCQATE